MEIKSRMGRTNPGRFKIKQWAAFRKELHLIRKMKIPRCVLLPSPFNLRPCLCDSSSEKAYCAAIYLKCIASEFISVSFCATKQELPSKLNLYLDLSCVRRVLSNVLQSVGSFLYLFTKPLPGRIRQLGNDVFLELIIQPILGTRGLLPSQLLARDPMDSGASRFHQPMNETRHLIKSRRRSTFRIMH
ncbi:hypothetical protein TNIN_128811 [Trichonephila inaurata madagascariensis]|uniref:Uncharacterized protein n=1 Tax=Trichonephila inaurata madagascariensis TaxID=2747483 RepID=A0A8X6YET0_9ARAC|nr:hypothetical protein TNIN_128811 [Trichonephila inaurata madagascariensis]